MITTVTVHSLPLPTAYCPLSPHSLLSTPPSPQLTVHSSLPTAYCPLPPHSLLSTPPSPQLTVHSSLPTAYCPLLPPHSLLSTPSPQLTVHSSLPTAYCPLSPHSLLSTPSLPTQLTIPPSLPTQLTIPSSLPTAYCPPRSDAHKAPTPARSLGSCQSHHMLLGCVVGGHSNEDTHYSTQREMWHYVGWPPSWAPRPETLYLSSSLALQGKRVTKFFCIIRIKYDITAAKLLSCPSKGLAKAVDVFYTHFVMVCVMCICVCVLCVQGVCVCVCVCVQGVCVCVCRVCVCVCVLTIAYNYRAHHLSSPALCLTSLVIHHTRDSSGSCQNTVQCSLHAPCVH